MVLTPQDLSEMTREDRVALVGQKANNLFELELLKVEVPPWIAVTTRFQDACWSHPANRSHRDRVDAHLINAVGLVAALPSLRESVRQLVFPPELEALLRKKLAFSRLGERLAVRSSGICEDSHAQSGAGMFASVLDVTPDAVEDAIRTCWASVFSEAYLLLFGNQALSTGKINMGVIIQRMVRADKSGVLFTVNPATGDRSQVVVEAGRGGCAPLAAGAGCAERLIVHKLNLNVTGSEDTAPLGPLGNPSGGRGAPVLNQNELEQLVKQALRTESHFCWPQDIEWAIESDRIFFLQTRPVTTLEPPSRDHRYEPMLFELHEAEEVPLEALGAHRHRLSRWKIKKIPFYKACRTAGIKVCRWIFLRVSTRTFDAVDWNALLGMLEAPNVYVGINETVMDLQIPTTQLKRKLLEIASLYQGAAVTVYLRENFPTEVAILSQMTPDGMIYLEVAPGFLSGINAGMVTPESCLVNPSSLSVRRSPDEPAGQPWYGASCRYVEPLDLETVAEGTLALQRELGNIVVEWWKWNGNVYANDVSLVRSSLPCTPDGTGRTLEPPFISVSPGSFEGPLVRLENCDEYLTAYMSHGRGISVMGRNPDVDNLEFIAALRRRLRRARSGQVKPVVWAEKPLLFLAPLVSEASGFVFRNASLLCHLSIILREQRVPAVSTVGRDLPLEDGEWFRYNDEP